MPGVYHYVMWRWFGRTDLDEVAEELSEGYEVRRLPDHGWDLELSYMKEMRDRYLVRSDTLVVFLSPFRAVLTQRIPAPLTRRDMELRERVLELYREDGLAYLPLQILSEPEFTTVEGAGPALAYKLV